MKNKRNFIAAAACAAVTISSMGLTACAETAAEAESYTELFGKDEVLEINIDIDETDLADILAYPTNEEYHAADITVNGITVEDAGIRTKGNMTLASVARSDSDRYSYRIKFNKYVKGNKLLGLDDLCLNNNYSDPSYMREYLHYEILEALGMNVPERAYCSLTINGEPAGFYLAVQALDGSFLETEFGADYKSGNFYSMDEGATLSYEEDETYSYAELKSGDDTEMTGLKSLIKTLDDMPDGEKGDIENCLDVDSALKYIASNTVLCNYDSYNGNMHHNYYLYEDADGVFTVVPWDFNMSFGGFDGAQSEVGIDTPVTSGSIDELPLIGKLLSVPEYKERYYGYIEEIMGILENFDKRVEELKDIIGPYVKDDPTAFYTYEEFEAATTASADTDTGTRRGGMGSVSIVDCVNDRLENLEAQLSGEVDTSTESSFGGRGGGMPGRGGMGGGMTPPEGMEMQEGMEMPEGMERPESGGMPGRGGMGGGMTPPEGMEQQGGMAPPEDMEMQEGGGMTSPDSMERQEGMEPPEGMEAPKRGDRPGMNGQNGTAADNIRVHVNGHIISFESEPYITDGSTLVGVRAILEALGADVTWDGDARTVTITKDGTEIVLTVGSETAYVNGEPQTLSAAPELSADSVMIPVRFISETLGMTVEWDENAKLITILSK